MITLKTVKLPQSWAERLGDEPTDKRPYLLAPCQLSRDTNPLEESNWEYQKAELVFWPDSVREVRERNPLTGWTDLIYVLASEANAVWRDCYQLKERVEYVRKHRGQFDFRSFSDMLSCLRGNYFAGYASELLSR